MKFSIGDRVRMKPPVLDSLLLGEDEDPHAKQIGEIVNIVHTGGTFTQPAYEVRFTDGTIETYAEDHLKLL